MSDRGCTHPGCERERTSRLHCTAHHRQWKKHGETFEIGDHKRRGALIKAAWDALSDEERAERLAPMQTSIQGKPRSAQHRQRLSESIRAAWSDGYDLTERMCRGCGDPFIPNSGNHFYCTGECQDVRKVIARHGLTNRQYLDILEAQGGVCALCKQKGRGFGATRSRYGLVIDHCHDTQKVRGLLCPDCNTALGRFGDDANRLRAAADYIDRTCPH